jgi:hypothetical protein
VLVGLTLAACGGSGGSATDTGTGTPTAATTTAGTTTGATKDEAQQLANSMLLRLSDFPAGWRATPSEDQEGCSGIDKLTERYDVLAKADSKDFATGDTTEASSSAGFFHDEAMAREALNYLEAAIQSKSLRDCLSDALRKDAEEGVTFGDIQVGQVSFPKLGDRSSAWEIVIPAKSQGFSFTAYIDGIYVIRSSALSVVLFSDVLEPFDVQERERLARLVDERMDAAVEQLSR